MTVMTHALAFMLPLLLAQGNQPQNDGTSWTVVWAVLLLGAAVALFFIEVFIPSAGLVGIAAAVCLVLGIVMLFAVGTWYGLVGAIVALGALPFAIGFALKMFPHTPIARALTLRSLKSDDDAAQDESEAEQTTAGQSEMGKAVPDGGPAVGDTGQAISACRPVGTCVINGKREQCLAVGGTITPNTQVRVVAVDGMHIRVKAMS